MRFLSSIALVKELVRVLGNTPSDGAAEAVGRLAAHLIVMRRLSSSVAGSSFLNVLAYTTLAALSFSLRGGTREILRGIIARGLGLR
ncbi:hypothetical protein V5F34_04675 [Xanthobacter autotrophicus]|uniref:hypothetical protein n=1 Tax=Xanthobacter autotrophicus TaxID=280 RepID=UPI00372ACFB1